MTALTDWPDPAKPGYPLHPEMHRAHVLKDSAGIRFILLWNATLDIWVDSFGEQYRPKRVEANKWQYLGSCRPPPLDQSLTQDLLEAAYDAGFAATGEGHNGEHPADLMFTDAYKAARKAHLMQLRDKDNSK